MSKPVKVAKLLAGVAGSALLALTGGCASTGPISSSSPQMDNGGSGSTYFLSPGTRIDVANTSPEIDGGVCRTTGNAYVQRTYNRGILIDTYQNDLYFNGRKDCVFMPAPEREPAYRAALANMNNFAADLSPLHTSSLLTDPTKAIFSFQTDLGAKFTALADRNSSPAAQWGGSEFSGCQVSRPDGGPLLRYDPATRQNVSDLSHGFRISCPINGKANIGTLREVPVSHRSRGYNP